MKDIKYLDLLSVCDGCLCSSRDELDGVSDEKVFENIFAFNTLVPVVPRALAQFFFPILPCRFERFDINY